MTGEAKLLHWFPEIVKTRPHLLLLGLFFLGAMHYQEAHPGGGGLELPYNLLSWIVVSFIIGAGLFLISRRKTVVFSPFTLCFLLCVCLLSLPTFFPGSRLINESGTHIGLLGGLLFYLALQQFRPGSQELRHILLLVLCSALIEALIGWYKYLGISLAEISMSGPGAAVPYGVIRQRNGLASLFVTGLVISGYLVRHLYWANSGRYVAIFSKVMLLATPVILIPLIVLLKSRTGWVACVVSLGLLIPCLLLHKKRKYPLLWIAGLVLGLAIVPLMNQVSDEVEVVQGEKLNLSGPRTYIYEQVIDMIKAKPILGYGFGSFESEYNRFAATGYANGDYESPAYPNLSHPHNEFLYWWVEGGLLAFIGLLVAAGFLLVRIFGLEDKPEKFALLALFFPIVFHAQTEIPFLISVGHWLIFLLLVLLVDVSEGKSLETEAHYYLLPAIMAVAIPAIVTAFMLTTLQSGRLLNQIEQDPDIEVSVLEKISNPVVWQDRLMWDMNFGLLVLAVYQNRPELAENYINWGNEIITRKPRAGYYHYLILAYQVKGDEASASKVRAEAKFRFPNSDFNVDLAEIMSIENKQIDSIQANIIED